MSPCPQPPAATGLPGSSRGAAEPRATGAALNRGSRSCWLRATVGKSGGKVLPNGCSLTKIRSLRGEETSLQTVTVRNFLRELRGTGSLYECHSKHPPTSRLLWRRHRQWDFSILLTSVFLSPIPSFSGTPQSVTY